MRLHQMLQVIIQHLGVNPFWQLRYLPVIRSVDDPGNRLYLATVFGMAPSLLIPIVDWACTAAAGSSGQAQAAASKQRVQKAWRMGSF